MSDQQQPTAPAGWHPDPAGTPRLRWWDGMQWTEHFTDLQPTAPAVGASYVPGTPFVTGAAYTATPAATFSGAASAPYTLAGQPLVAPAGVPIYTGFVWAIVAVQVLTPILSVAILLSAGSDAVSLMANASLILVVNLLGIVAYGGSVWLAYLDHRTLVNAGVPNPFHWAWIFFAVIGAPVYMIGRSVVVRRRVGSGLAPMIVNLALVVASFVLGIVAAVLAVGSVFDSGLIPPV